MDVRFSRVLLYFVVAAALTDLGVIAFTKLHTIPAAMETPALPVMAEDQAPITNKENTPLESVVTPPPPPVTTEETPEKKSPIMIPPLGTKIGDFTLIWVSAKTKFVTSLEGYRAEYSGTSTVSGKLFWNDMGNEPCFSVTRSNKRKIPSIIGYGKDADLFFFCFSNDDALPLELKKASTSEQTIMIGGYDERVEPKESFDRTLLVKILPAK